MSILLSIVHFADTSSVDSSVPLSAQPRDKRFHWVGVQLGLASLLQQLLEKNLTASNTHSTWLSAFEEVSSLIADIFDHRDGNVDIPESWADFLDIYHNSSCSTHPYLRVIRRLIHITPPPTHGDRDIIALRDVQFVEGLNPTFLALLQDLDSRALILFAQWLGILCNHGIWWCRPRATIECWRICDFIATQEPHLMSWLTVPANACGYILCPTRNALEDGIEST